VAACCTGTPVQRYFVLLLAFTFAK